MFDYLQQRNGQLLSEEVCMSHYGELFIYELSPKHWETMYTVFHKRNHLYLFIEN